MFVGQLAAKLPSAPSLRELAKIKDFCLRDCAVRHCDFAGDLCEYETFCRGNPSISLFG